MSKCDPTLERNEEKPMSGESMKSIGYDPIEDDELAEDPMSSTHTDLPDPDDDGHAAPESPELRERMERARERIRRRDAERDRPYKESSS